MILTNLDVSAINDGTRDIGTKAIRFCVIALFSGMLLLGCENDLPSAEKQLADLDSLERVIRSQQVDLERIDRASDPINSFQLKQLESRGFYRPHDQLLEDLQETEGLIKYDGVLGGQMQFRKITLLTNRWVMAEFDDGHIQGYALLEMVISKKGDVTWTLLSSYVQ